MNRLRRKSARSWGLLLGVWLAALAGGRLHAAEPERGKRPSFLCMLADDLGYGDLACYGSRTIRTPHLDRMAAEGLRLESCYAAAPVCSPSRAGFLTGRIPARTGVHDWIPAGSAVHLGRDEVTVANLLKRGGYATCHVGKWHLNGKFNDPSQPQPGDHGFDWWFSTQNNASPSHEDPRNFVRNGKPVVPENRDREERYSCQIVAEEAIRWLESVRTSGKPFFLFVCFHEPHEPIASPADIVALYPDATKRGEALYRANVTNLDRAVGSLLAALERLGLAGDTLAFFTSDNGPETLDRYAGAWRSHGSPGPLRGMKLHLHEGGIRVPGILRWPGRIPPGGVSDEPVSGTDVLPTLCALAGVPVPRERPIDGASFVPVLAGERIERKTPLFWFYHRSIGPPKAAARAGDWKVLGLWDGELPTSGSGSRPDDGRPIGERKLTGFELYDLRSDQAEGNDLSAREGERLDALAGRLRELHAEVVGESVLRDAR